MARKWYPPHGMCIDKAIVHGIFTRWAREEDDEDNKQRLRSETWEVVVPQLILKHNQPSDKDRRLSK